jgi:hypothetical protein
MQKENFEDYPGTRSSSDINMNAGIKLPLVIYCFSTYIYSTVLAISTT